MRRRRRTGRMPWPRTQISTVVSPAVSGLKARGHIVRCGEVPPRRRAPRSARRRDTQGVCRARLDRRRIEQRLVRSFAGRPARTGRTTRRRPAAAREPARAVAALAVCAFTPRSPWSARATATAATRWLWPAPNGGSRERSASAAHVGRRSSSCASSGRAGTTPAPRRVHELAGRPAMRLPEPNRWAERRPPERHPVSGLIRCWPEL